MSNEVLKNILTHSKNTKSLIGLHRSDMTISDFTVGYVIDFDETFIVIQHVTKYGVKDGIHIEKIEKIENIETDSDYTNSCQLLFENSSLLPEQSIKRSVFGFTDSWQYEFLNGNSCIGELIAFELGGEGMFNYGFLIDFDHDNFNIHLVGQAGESQGTYVYHLDDIVSLGLDTLECRKRTLMYKHKHK